MWLLRLLPWCFLLSLSWAGDCNWKMPETETECTQIIRWKVHTDKQATSTCLEYFPTTFVEGIIDQADVLQIKCTVYRQFQCDHLRKGGVTPYSIFDKCYIFRTVEEKTMTQYIAERNNEQLCGEEGMLPVFFSMSQGKHIAKQAHRLGINKMWVNIDKDGKTIEKSSINPKGAGDLVYKEQWKLHNDMYWNGEEIKMLVKGADGKWIVPEAAKYLFFRTRTDHVNNLYQGSFERASAEAKASIVCEYPAKIVPDQKRYCAKMKALGLNAMYDDKNGRKRCIYSTLTKYPLLGTKEAIKDFKGCGEKPSEEHKSSLDDGTASKSVYDELTKGGSYRVAGIKSKMDLNDHDKMYATKDLKKCDKRLKENGFNRHDREGHRMPFEIFDHFGKKDFSSKMSMKWDDEYPKNECSDFPEGIMDSNTLAIKNSKIIDVPVPIRLPVLCSISTNVDCGLNPTLCSSGRYFNNRDDLICEDVATWNDYTDRYAQCVCARFHEFEDQNAKIEDTKCIWKVPGYGSSCAMIHRFDSSMDSGWIGVDRENTGMGWPDPRDIKFAKWNDLVDWIAVRHGCKASVWTHPPTNLYSTKLVDNVGYGVHVVPNDKAGTLNGWESGMSASRVDCKC